MEDKLFLLDVSIGCPFTLSIEEYDSLHEHKSISLFRFRINSFLKELGNDKTELIQTTLNKVGSKYALSCYHLSEITHIYNVREIRPSM